MSVGDAERRFPMPLERPLKEDDQLVAAPRFPTIAPQRPKTGSAYVDVDDHVLRVWLGGEWWEVPLLGQNIGR